MITEFGQEMMISKLKGVKEFEIERKQTESKGCLLIYSKNTKARGETLCRGKKENQPRVLLRRKELRKERQIIIVLNDLDINIVRSNIWHLLFISYVCNAYNNLKNVYIISIFQCQNFQRLTETWVYVTNSQAQNLIPNFSVCSISSIF